MKDIEIAKKILLEESLTLVVVKDGELVFKSVDKGIKPIFTLATEMKESANGGSLADRVIGKGAAILSGYIGIKEVYTELISEGGVRTLEKYNIAYTMDKSCEYIKNREGTGYCPIEKLSMDVDEPRELLEKLKIFFASIARK